jgi:hypothetical protein
VQNLSTSAKLREVSKEKERKKSKVLNKVAKSKVNESAAAGKVEKLSV